MYLCATIGFPDKAGFLLASLRYRKERRNKKRLFFGRKRVRACPDLAGWEEGEISHCHGWDDT